MPTKPIALEDLAQAVSEGVLRAIAANTQFKTFLSKDGPGLIVRPIVTAGGIYYFGAAGRFASGAVNAAGGIEALGQ
jgi:hypothetical protein